MPSVLSFFDSAVCTCICSEMFGCAHEFFACRKAWLKTGLDLLEIIDVAAKFKFHLF